VKPQMFWRKILRSTPRRNLTRNSLTVTVLQYQTKANVFSFGLATRRNHSGQTCSRSDWRHGGITRGKRVLVWIGDTAESLWVEWLLLKVLRLADRSLHVNHVQACQVIFLDIRKMVQAQARETSSFPTLMMQNFFVAHLGLGQRLSGPRS